MSDKNCGCVHVQPFRTIMKTYNGVENDACITVIDNKAKTIEVKLKQQQYTTKYEFPNIGNPAVVYVDKTANRTYRWDDTDMKYYCIGSDYNEIKVIHGGTANGN